MLRSLIRPSLQPFFIHFSEISTHTDAFFILILRHWYTSSWETMCLVSTTIKCRSKVKATLANRVVHLTKMGIKLVLFRRSVDSIIHHFWHFYQIWIDIFINLENNRFFLLIKIFLDLGFSTSLMELARSHTSNYPYFELPPSSV